jgi:adenylate cyclase
MLNTGSRLEGLNKAIGSRICVSRDVVERCRRHRFQRIGTFIVKGRQAETEVFTPLDPYRPAPPWLDRYEAALRALEASAPDTAERFAELQREVPDDPCIAFHCRRLSQGEAGPLIEMDIK